MVNMHREYHGTWKGSGQLFLGRFRKACVGEVVYE